MKLTPLVLALFTCFAATSLIAAVTDETPRSGMSAVSGEVHAVAVDNGVIYLGGDFTTAGTSIGRLISVDRTTGELDFTYPNVGASTSYGSASRAWCVVDDGSGGWFVGGAFTIVDSTPCNNIIHVLPNRTIDPNFLPNVSSAIAAMTRVGSTLYIGGYFGSVNGQTREKLAAFDITTGVLLDFAPVINGTNYVWGLAASDTALYVGGPLDQAGGQTRNNLCAFDADPNSTTYGELLDWNPDADGWVNALAVSGDMVYAAGMFANVGGVPHWGVVQIDSDTASGTYGQATSWDPQLNNIADDVEVDGFTVYVCGPFQTVAGVDNYGVVALDGDPGSTTYGQKTAWNATAGGGGVSEIALDLTNNTIILGGSFTLVNGQFGFNSATGRNEYFGGTPRNGLAEIDLATGQLTSWYPDNSYGGADALGVDSGHVYVGGGFTLAQPAERQNLAALDATTGELLDWAPLADGIVKSLAVYGNTVYAGGEFTTINGSAANCLAAIDADPASTTYGESIATIDASSTVFALVADGTTIYVGGQFTDIAGTTRNRLAAIDATSNTLNSWDPDAGSPVMALAYYGGVVYAGGFFTTIGAASRDRLAAIDADQSGGSYGQILSWDPGVDQVVSAIEVSQDGSVVYIGGSFTNVGGFGHDYLAAVDSDPGSADYGKPTLWNPLVNDRVSTLRIFEDLIYVGGAFTEAGGQERNVLAAIYVDPTHPSFGGPDIWNPQVLTREPIGWVRCEVNCLAVSDDTLYVGGEFWRAGPSTMTYFGGFGITPGTSSSGPLEVTTASLPEGTEDQYYRERMFAAGGTPPYTWLVRYNRAMPDGLVLYGTGDIIGTPAPGSALSSSSLGYALEFEVTDSTGTKAFSDRIFIKINGTTYSTPLTIESTTLPDAVEGRNYRNQLEASGGTTPYSTWDIVSGALPTGMYRVGAGIIAGTPALGTAGDHSVQFKVTDSAGGEATSATITLTVVLQGSGGLEVTTTSPLPPATETIPYSFMVQAQGGTPPYLWSLPVSSPPSGMDFNYLTGEIFGAPDVGVADPNGNGSTTTWNYMVTFEVTDSTGATARSTAMTLTVNEQGTAVALMVLTSSLSQGMEGVTYSETLQAVGGTAPYTWSVSSGTLPSGLFLNTNTGVIDGTPDTSTAGSYPLVFQVMDNVGATATGSSTINLVINPATGALTVLTTSLLQGVEGVVYADSLQAAGGISPYSWQITSGTLPTTLSLDSGGQITGTPDAGQAGTYDLVFQVTDDVGTTAGSATVTLTVTDAGSATLTVTTTSLAGAEVQNLYAATLSATGGSGNYSWAIVSGQLPTGLTLSPSGLISGTPAQGTAADYPLVFEVTDSNGLTAQSNAMPLSVTIPNLLLSLMGSGGGCSVADGSRDFGYWGLLLILTTLGGSLYLWKSGRKLCGRHCR